MNESKNYCNEVIDVETINQEKIFRFFLRFLDANNIVYAVLGPREPFADQATDGDIDFVISKKDFKKISFYIQKFCKQNNLTVVQMRQHESTACIFVLSYYNLQQKRFDYIKVDFCSDYIKRGRFYLSSQELLENRSYKYNEDYWQLNDTYFFIYYFLKKIDKRNITSQQFIQLVKCWNNANATIVEKLKFFFNDSNLSVIAKAFEEKNFNYLRANIISLNENLHKKISKQLSNIISQKLRVLRSFIKPRGIVIAVLGRDGSGKSTFVNEMISAMRPYFSKTERFHTFPGLLYRRGMFNANPERQTDLQQMLPGFLYTKEKKKKKKNGFSHFTPHNQKVRSTSTSFLKLNLFFFESLIGYWLKIFPKKAKSHFVLFDRYFIDVLADPVRYRIKAKKIYIKALHFILPKPDIWIIIDLPTDVLLKRKQELSYETAEELRQSYLNLHNFLSNSIVVNNDGEIKDTVNEASNFILNYMREKIL
jgi:thymidylate kinase